MLPDEYKLKGYQDDLDTDPNKRDLITEEASDSLSERAGIPEDELAHELKRISFDEEGRGDDDMRELIEDRDEDMGQTGDSTTDSPTD